MHRLAGVLARLRETRGVARELLGPIEVDDDPERAEDEAYVQKIYDEVHAAIQAGMDRLAAKRTLPILG